MTPLGDTVPIRRACPEAERGDGVRSPPIFFFLITAGDTARTSHSGGWGTAGFQAVVKL